jgi:hypothetical protein
VKRKGHEQVRRRINVTKRILTLACLTIVGLSLLACGWKPKVAAVAITAPWDKMNLPVKQDAVVWGSTATEFKAVHKDDRKTVLGKYVEALKSQGWTLTKFDDKQEHSYYVDMAKGADKIRLEIYDFENTGVIITKK